MNVKVQRIPANKYVTDDFYSPLHHRNIYIAAYGPISEDDHVHHIDCCKWNNELDNLIHLPRDLHKWVHKYHLEYILLVRKGIVDKPFLERIRQAYLEKRFSIHYALRTVVYNLIQEQGEWSSCN
jgi:hypothetical protein